MTQALYDEFMKVRNQDLVKGAPDEMLEKMHQEIITEMGSEPQEDDSSIPYLICQEIRRRKAWRELQAAEPLIENPEVVVKKDFDNYFENLVHSWIAEHKAAGHRFRHSKITITAGPYRSSGISLESDGHTLEMDFYSAIRAGFGGLSEKDVADIKQRWL